MSFSLLVVSISWSLQRLLLYVLLQAVKTQNQLFFLRFSGGKLRLQLWLKQMLYFLHLLSCKMTRSSVRLITAHFDLVYSFVCLLFSRFMATNDLMTELQKDSIKLDDDSERKVRVHDLALLHLVSV